MIEQKNSNDNDIDGQIFNNFLPHLNVGLLSSLEGTGKSTDAVKMYPLCQSAVLFRILIDGVLTFLGE